LPSSIAEIQREYKNRGLVVLAVSIREPRATVAAWGERVGIGFPLLLDEDGSASRAWRVRSTPTVYLVDRQGRVVGRTVGTKAWTSPAGRALIAALIGS
jgi:peroxiredoxin